MTTGIGTRDPAALPAPMPAGSRIAWYDTLPALRALLGRPWVLASAALVLLGAAPAAPTGESALFAWADRCPSTAIRAGFYQGEGAEILTVGGKSVIRVRTHSEGASHTGSSTATTWLLADGCRAVGLVQEGVTAGGSVAAGFIVAKEGGVPRPDEQATLLGWAGKHDFDATKPEQAVAAALLTPRPAAEAVHGPIEGTLFRTPGRVWHSGPVPAQVGAWKPSTVAPDDAVCPCWEVVGGLGAPTRSVHGDSVLYGYGITGPHVTIVEDPTRTRWAVAPKTPDAGTPLAGTAPTAVATWVVGTWTDTTQTTLSVRDPATDASFVLVVAGAAAGAWSAEGVRLGDATVPIGTMRGWLGE